MERDRTYLEDLNEDVLKDAIRILENIEAASGRKQKETILHEGKDNPVLQEILLCALGKDKYYITIDGDVQSDETRYPVVESFTKFLSALNALTERRISGNDAKQKVTAFLSKCHPRLRQWYLRILDHDLRLGISKATVEKVFGSGFWYGKAEDEFHFHGCCLAKKFEDVFTGDKSPQFPIGAEFKLDGERALAFVFPEPGGGSVQYYSRDGLRKPEIEGVEELTLQYLQLAAKVSELAGLPSNSPIFLDGEFLASDWNETSSVVSKSTNFDAAEFLSKLKVILFDWCPIAAYISKGFEMPWASRKKLLMRAAGATRPYEKVLGASEHLYVLGHRVLRSIDDMNFFFGRANDGGFEGIMLKVLDAPLQFDRKHKYVIKLKPEDADTGTIVDAVAGLKQNGPADTSEVRKVRSALTAHGAIDDDGYYLHVKTDDPAQVAMELRELINDERDRRISTHLPGTVSYRYSERLGAFVVDINGEQVHVGGGFTFKAGQDQRMEFWQRRADLVGTKIDIKLQADKSQVAKARFNRFVRLREDL